MNHDLGLTTDPDSSVPLYRQIAAQVADRIRQGTLPPGFRLPATRRLAAELQTHRNTIVAAFDHLAASGLVVSGVGRYQTAGEKAVEIRAGDTIWIPPGERHWHGAAPDTAMCHVAFQEALDGTHIEWKEPVSDADYTAAP